jgi:hypothetical protein
MLLGVLPGVPLGALPKRIPNILLLSLLLGAALSKILDGLPDPAGAVLVLLCGALELPNMFPKLLNKLPKILLWANTLFLPRKEVEAIIANTDNTVTIINILILYFISKI